MDTCCSLLVEEGVNYNLDANGYVTTEGIDPALAWNSAEMQPLTQLANMVYIFSDIELQARYPSYTTINGRTMAPLSYLAGFTAEPWTEATGAGMINPPDNAADFTRFYSENIVNFVLGQQELNETTWAEFLTGSRQPGRCGTGSRRFGNAERCQLLQVTRLTDQEAGG